MNVTEMREKLAALYAEGAPLAERSMDGELTADEAARFDALATEARELAGRLADTEKRTAVANEVMTGHHVMTTPRGARAAAADMETRPAAGGKTLGRRFVESDAYQEAMRSRRGVTGRENALHVGSFEARTLVATGAFPAQMIQDQVLAGIYRNADIPLRVRDVLLAATTTSDAITWIKESAFTNNAAEAAQATTTSDGAKPESALTFTQASANVVTIAHMIPVTRQALMDAGQLESYITQRLVYGVRQREDSQLLNGDGTGANMTGLLATSGIQVLDNTYFSAAPVNNAGTQSENINRIRRAERKIMVDGYGTANFVIMHPADVEKFETYTTSDRAYLAGGPFSATLAGAMWGLQVVETQQITEGTALVGDGTLAAVYDRMDATIFTTDSHSDWFARNIVAIMAEERIALAVFRPGAFAKVTLA